MKWAQLFVGAFGLFSMLAPSARSDSQQLWFADICVLGRSSNQDVLADEDISIEPDGSILLKLKPDTEGGTVLRFYTCEGARILPQSRIPQMKASFGLQGIDLSFPSDSDFNYVVEAAELITGPWQAVTGPISGTNETVRLSLAPGVAPQGFFRIRMDQRTTQAP